MSDKEKLNKVLEYVTAKENYFYKPIENGEHELGSNKNIQCMLQAASYQDIRYFIEDLIDGNR